eukprot:scaffold10485_cov106-Skeletonema_dohrnii-CCMP3373.AAC.8
MGQSKIKALASSVPSSYCLPRYVVATIENDFTSSLIGTPAAPHQELSRSVIAVLSHHLYTESQSTFTITDAFGDARLVPKVTVAPCYFRPIEH